VPQHVCSAETQFRSHQIGRQAFPRLLMIWFVALRLGSNFTAGSANVNSWNFSRPGPVFLVSGSDPDATVSRRCKAFPGSSSLLLQTVILPA